MYNNYEQILNFFEERKKLGIQLGLDRMKQLLMLLNNPQDNINGIHVAGTNGKGSTIHFISSALIENGYEVGVFTSPSFDGLQGHILLNGKIITERQFISLFNEVHTAVKRLDRSGVFTTEFEIITAIAFLFFSKNVDIALIETGMGGRDDTTNCFQPILSIITNVDNDHTSFLGNTLKEIALHKAGIIKNETPVIVGPVHKEVLEVINKEIRHKNAQQYFLNQEFTCKTLNQHNHQSFIWEFNDHHFKVDLSMVGDHQIDNSSLALMALFLMKEHGLRIEWDKVLRGISVARLPGRFEVISIHKNTIIFDGAHNLAGVKSFINTVETLYGDITNKQLIFAAFKDKEFEKMLSQLKPFFAKVILTTFPHPRAIPSQSLRKMENIDEGIAFADLQKVMNQLKQSNCDQNYYFFTGSIHFISYVRKLLLNN